MKKINYSELNSRQKEIYNYQRVSALFAENGYMTIRLSDDFNGADFIAINFKDKTDILYVQLKGRLELNKKYENQDLKICFEDKKTKNWYLVDHDKTLKRLKEIKSFSTSSSWMENGMYSFRTLSKTLIEEFKNQIL